VLSSSTSQQLIDHYVIGHVPTPVAIVFLCAMHSDVWLTESVVNCGYNARLSTEWCSIIMFSLRSSWLFTEPSERVVAFFTRMMFTVRLNSAVLQCRVIGMLSSC